MVLATFAGCILSPPETVGWLLRHGFAEASQRRHSTTMCVELWGSQLTSTRSSARSSVASTSMRTASARTRRSASRAASVMQGSSQDVSIGWPLALGQAGGMRPQDPPLSALLEQERRLTFRAFDFETAWLFGSRLRAGALQAQLPLAISIRRNGQVLFHAALPGSSADNDEWLLRKAAVVERYGHSSFYVGCQFRAEGGDFDTDARLDRSRYAAHGGAFPLILADGGRIGTVAVSGLPEVEDHRFVVQELERFLGT